MTEERRGLLERLKTRRTFILREPLSARLERKVHGSTRGGTEKSYFVRYIDSSTGRTVEKVITEMEQFDLYKLQREGKINIIEITALKPITSSPVETYGSSNPKFWAVTHNGFSDRFYNRDSAINYAKQLEEKWGKAVQVKVAEYTPDPTEPTGYKIQVIYPESKLLLYSAQEKSTSELAEAKRQLKIYSERVGCSWCQRKASEIAGLIEKLESLTPLASQFAEQVGSLEAENIQRLNEEIRQVTNQNCPTCKIKR